MNINNNFTETVTACGDVENFLQDDNPCGLFVVHAPAGAVTADRVVLEAHNVVGRGANCQVIVRDSQISGEHFSIYCTDEAAFVEDGGSRNGTFVNGYKLIDRQRLNHNDVIRAGRTVFVFCSNMVPFLAEFPQENYGIAGDFCAGSLISEIKSAALSERHLLVCGPSGAGKELVAGALSKLLKTSGSRAASKFVVHNAAKFSSDEEATTTLFGVAPKVFSNVDARMGLIEQASGGILFIDEVHMLPLRVQKSLLRLIEDGVYSRIGDAVSRKVFVRFVFASNEPGPTYGIAHDLLARLRLVQAPPLSVRRADIPSIFFHLLKHSFAKFGLNTNSIISLFTADHIESLCLDGFADGNVRALGVLVDKLVTLIRSQTPPQTALRMVFAERFTDGPVAARYGKTKKTPAKPAGSPKEKNSTYEQHKDQIISVYNQYQGNISATERELYVLGIPCSRRWLTHFLQEWGIRKKK